MTTTATIPTIQQVRGAESPSVSTYTFTLVFPSGLVTVLEVRGAADQETARAIAQQAVKHRQRINLRGDTIEIPMRYTVLDGDVSGDLAASCCAWICTASESQPGFRPEPKRYRLLLQNAEEGQR